jgi:hypothetical protein
MKYQAPYFEVSFNSFLGSNVVLGSLFSACVVPLYEKPIFAPTKKKIRNYVFVYFTFYVFEEKVEKENVIITIIIIIFNNALTVA